MAIGTLGHFEQAAKCYRRGGHQPGELLAMGRVLLLKANELEQQSSLSEGAAAVAMAAKTEEVESLLFDAGYCFAAIHNAQEARRCFERAKETALVEGLLECGGEDDKICCICIERIAETRLVPCDHVCLCKTCMELHVVEEMGTCALCRQVCEAVECIETKSTLWSALEPKPSQLEPLTATATAAAAASHTPAESDEAMARRLQAEFDA